MLIQQQIFKLSNLTLKPAQYCKLFISEAN